MNNIENIFFAYNDVYGEEIIIENNVNINNHF